MMYIELCGKHYWANYQFNPDIIIRGGAEKRIKMLIEYNFGDEKALDNKVASEKQLDLFTGEEIIDVTPIAQED